MKRYTDIIKELREDNDYTQEEIAKKLNCSQTAYGKYENGKRNITVDNLIILAKFYNVSMDYITGLTNIKTPNWTIKNNSIKNSFNNNSGNIKITQKWGEKMLSNNEKKW